jgi:hypothetical protein
MRLRHRRAHLALWGLMALLLPAVLIGALALRLGTPAPDAPVRIAPP